jgi:tRNA(Ile)-lysidine synthase
MRQGETALVVETFRRALDSISARVFVSTPDTAKAMAVAYSGGLDSSALLHLAQAYAHDRGIALFAFHVHHGLSPNADVWLAHCRDACLQYRLSFDACSVTVRHGDGQGVEEAARIARYAALGEMCRLHGVPLLLTAHHQDDQAETVLLQMLRGAGLPGLSGMDEMNAAPELLGGLSPTVARPLLLVSRSALEAYAQSEGVAHVEDESNRNLHHPRNALRSEVLPLLAAHFPAYRDCLARSARHAQAAERLLEELAAQDLATCLEGKELNADRVGALSTDRIANLLRYWLADNGLRPPSTAWLHEAQTQLLDARADAQPCVILGSVALRRYRKRIVMTPAVAASEMAPVVFRWQGEASLPFPAYGGVLHFELADTGCDPGWLRAQLLRIQFRSGGGKLKLAPNRPTRSLKDHYQSLGIPAWERTRLPLVYAGESMLFAAGIGQDCRYPVVGGGVRLRWQMD